LISKAKFYRRSIKFQVQAFIVFHVQAVIIFQVQAFILFQIQALIKFQVQALTSRAPGAYNRDFSSSTCIAIQSHDSTKFGRDGLQLSYGQFAISASADPYTNCSYESFRRRKSRSPGTYVNCPYDCKVGAVSTKLRGCEGLPYLELRGCAVSPLDRIEPILNALVVRPCRGAYIRPLFCSM